ncbi:MAG: SCP2 sterol-binding domain-containing protein [Candidatus Hodarchaeota archaeon]
MGPGKDATKEFAEAINNNAEVQEMLKNWNKVAAYDLEGEDGIFQIIFHSDGTAEFKDEAPENPSFTFKATTQLWADIQLGKKDGQKEFFAKNLKIEGDVMATMKLTQIGKKLLEAMGS